MADGPIYNVELFRGDGGTFYMLWVQEVRPTRFARYRLEVPTVEANIIRTMDDAIWMAYAKRKQHLAVRIETDGAKDYYGPRGPGGRANSKADSSQEVNASNGSKGGKAARRSMATVRRKGNTNTGPDA